MKKSDFNNFRSYKADINKRVRKNDEKDSQFRFTSYNENRGKKQAQSK